MTQKMQLRLLGSFQVGDDIRLRRKNRAILAYLALSTRPISRHELAELFCQSAADPAHTLRLSLSRLRRHLGQEALIFEGDAVRLHHDYFELDIRLFQQHLSPMSLTNVSSSTLRQTVSLYRGEFLQSLTLPDAPEFEMWLVGQRSHWQQLYERGALALLKQLILEEQYAEAVPVAQRLVQQNPLLEEAHYHLIWLYAQTDQRAAAIAQFEQCQTILHEELAVEPTPPLQTLHAQIVAGRLTQPHAITPVPSLTLAATPASDFVGRETEWAHLDKLWGDVRLGNGRTLLITAEAGGGKTRLVHEWAHALPDAIFLYGPCYESTRTLAYHPWLKILAQLQNHLETAVLNTLPVPWFEALTRLLPGLAASRHASIAGEQAQLFTAVHACLNLAPQPLLLFLDDWQWADAASLQLLHFLVEREGLSVMLVGAYRPEEVEENPALLTLLDDWARRQDIMIMTLAPLSGTAVSELMRRLWPDLPAGYREPHLRDRLIQATNGNPLFVSEIVRELAGTSHLPEELPVPPSLRDLIQRRLRHLSASGRQVLESLAVLDQPAEFDLVRQVSGRSEEETLTSLEVGLRWRLLRIQASNRLDFSHDLMRQAVRQLLSPIRRQLLHRRTAVALSRHPTPAATLAFHWAQAGDKVQEGKYAAMAGREAADLYAYQEALYYWQRALDLTTDNHTRASLLLQLGETSVMLGEWEKAKTHYEEGLRLATDDRLRASLQGAMSALLEYVGEYEPALQMVQQAIAYFTAVKDWEQVVRLWGYYGRIYWRQGQYEQALQTYQNALSYAPRLPDDRPLIRLHNNIGLVHWQRQQYQSAMNHFQQARQMAEAHQHKIALAIALGNIGNIHKDLGDYEQTLLYYEQALALDTELGNKMGMARHLGNIGVTYHNIAQFDEALAYYERALRLDKALGHQEGVARHLGNIGTIYYAQGNYVETLTYFAQALSLDAELGNRAGVALHVGNMGSVYKMLGADDEATACLIYAAQLDLELGNKTGVARHLGNLADVCLQQNRMTEALVVCDLAVGLLQLWRQDHHLCWNLWLKGKVLLTQGVYSASVDYLRQAQTIAAKVQRQDVLRACRVMLPRVRLLGGECTAVSAQQQLTTLLNQTTDPRQQAVIYYELWHLDKNPAHQTQARRAFEALLPQSQTAADRQHAAELGVTDLPPPLAVLPIPTIVVTATLDLDSLLKKVTQILAP